MLDTCLWDVISEGVKGNEQLLELKNQGGHSAENERRKEDEIWR